MRPMIETIGLGKRYMRRTGRRARYQTLRDTLTNGARQLLGLPVPFAEETAKSEAFWAFKDINITVGEGEVVGIIGRNGAGKSTLLKVLSRITAPTEGEARLHGRVGSLLEVGTGFHPELTGRENVYMNGLILGMSRKEMDAKFEEIVEFSGVRDFLDTPVKWYSSGMYMRLAFSVAAHLDPEILVVDEVLAVGDADFQKKCLGKMKSASSSGRTVLFVSHNMNAIQQMCSRVIWLDKGRIVMDTSNIHAAASAYLFGQDEKQVNGEWLPDADSRIENEYFRLNRFRMLDPAGKPLNTTIPNNISAQVEIEFELIKKHPALNFGYVIYDENGQTVYWTTTTDTAEDSWPALVPGSNVIRSSIPSNLLNAGQYRLDLFASLHAQGYLSEPGNTHASIFLNIMGGMSESPYWRNRRPGMLAPVLSWKSHNDR